MRRLLFTFLLPVLLLSREPKDILKESQQMAKSIPKMRVDEAILIYHWLSNCKEIAIHQQRGAKENRIYLGPKGHREAVYDSSGKIVRDGINDGTYNYAHPHDDPINHFTEDILPWILWGATRSDSTSMEERLRAYAIDLNHALRDAQQNANRITYGRGSIQERIIGYCRFYPNHRRR